MIERVVYLRHRECFRDGGNRMARAEFQHRVDGDGTAGGRTANGLLSRDEAECRYLEGLEDGADVMQAPLRPENVKKRGNLQRDIDRRDNEVQGAGEFLERIGIPGVMDKVSAKLPGLGFLAIAGGKCVDLAAPLAGKLERHVPEAANADDAHTGRGGHPVEQQRREDGNATTEQGAGGRHIEPIGKRPHPCPLGANSVRETAMTAHDGSLRGRAEMMVARKALVAGETTVCGPTEANLLTDLQPLRGIAKRRYGADHLVAGNERVPRHAPLVVQHREVRVADSAVSDLDFHLLGTEVAGSEAEWLQRTFGGCGGVGVIGGHGFGCVVWFDLELFFVGWIKSDAGLGRVRRREEAWAQLLDDIPQGDVVAEECRFDFLQPRFERDIG